MSKEWINEFDSFLKGDEAPPLDLSKNILGQVYRELHPSFAQVLIKLSVIQLAVGAATVSFCPQLGVGLGGHGLMTFFMFAGPTVCAALCGGFYLGVSVLFAAMFLRPEELRKVRQSHLVYIPALSAVSFILLVILGASGTAVIYGAWLLGAILAGELSALGVAKMRLRCLTPIPS